MFVSMLWYRNVSSEGAQGRLGLLGHKTKTVLFTVDLLQLNLPDYRNVATVLEAWLNYMDGTSNRKQQDLQQLSV